VTIVSAGEGVHRSLEAARDMEREGISAGALDLRTIPFARHLEDEIQPNTARLPPVFESCCGERSGKSD
jgi:transketolase C-terminal domain/subunit